MIARRGWTSRLAAMGITSNARSSGVGTWAMEQLIEEAKARGEKEMVLEVIEQNTAGVKLYEKSRLSKIQAVGGIQTRKPAIESDAQFGRDRHP
jgi:ribosomal protein S18 acetylase RimI-like enzyme